MTWRGLDHPTIFEMVVRGGQGIGVSDAAESGWRAAHQALLDADGIISGALLASGSAWQGTGADAMRTAFSPLAQWALDAVTSAGGTAVGVGDQAVLAMETRRLVADNAPPQTPAEHVVDVVGSWNWGSPYAAQADAVDRLMADYEAASVPNEQRFDTWSVPPTVVVTPADAGPSGPAAGGVGALRDTGGLGPPAGSSIAAALASVPAEVGPNGSGVGSAGPGVGAGPPPAPAGTTGAVGVPGATAMPATGGVGGGRVDAGGVGAGGVGAGGVGVNGVGAVGVGAGGAGAGGVGTGAAGAGAPGVGRPGPGAGRLGTGGIAHPSRRPPGSPGGSGTGPGPWSHAAAATVRPPVATPSRPVGPPIAARTATPDWRSVLLPPERGVLPAPGEPVPRGGAPAGSAPAQAATPGTGARTAGAPGVHAPLPGGGAAGGAPGEGRRRPSYLVDDSDAFVDRRWVQPAVITPEDLIPDEYGRLPGQ